MKTFSLFAVAGLLILSILSGHSAGAPSAATGNPTSITTNAATLNGSANPNGVATVAYFEWGTTTNYGSSTALQSLGAGIGAVPVQANLSSLLTDANYHYRLVASNASGITSGSDVIVTPTLLLYLYAGESWTYTFHDLPLAGSFPNSGFGFVSSTFVIHPNSFSPGSSVRFEFFWNSTNDPSPPASSVVNAPAENGFVSNGPGFDLDHQGTVRLTMLTGSVVVASIFFYETGPSSSGFAPSWQNTIVPTRLPQPPSLGTNFVSSISISSAIVTVSINARNVSSGLFAQWGATTNYGFASSVLGVDFDYFVTRQITLTNLAPGTTYHCRVAATSSAGATYGNDLVFTTLAPATVTTLPASERKTTSVVLNASASVNGLATTAYFEWGTTTNYGQLTTLQNLGSPVTVTNLSAPLAGLTSQTTYHYRAVVFSTGVTNRGNDVAFVTTPPATDLVVTNLATADVRGAIESGGSVTFACDGILVLSNQIEIANDVHLNASGHSITLSGNNVTRIFKILPGTLLTLTNIALVNGRITNSGGGAIYNDGAVVVEGCQFLNNAAVGATGTNGTNGAHGTSSTANNPGVVTAGQPGQNGAVGANASGGAIMNSGTLTLWRCFFGGNSAAAGPGGNGGSGGNGGQTPIPRPAYGASGGAGGNGGKGGKAEGGAVANFGILSLKSCTFSNSMVLGGAGGMGGIGGSAGYIGFQGGNGGAGGTSGLASGSALFSIGNTSISNSLFVANQTLAGSGGGGGIGGIGIPGQGASGTGADGAPATAGGVYNQSNCILVNCTFNGNAVSGGNGGAGGNSGAAGGKGGSASGGGLFNGGVCQLINLTMSGNAAYRGTGTTNGVSLGGSTANTGSVFQIVNSILSDGFSNNCFGAITDLGHNISSDATPAWSSGTSLNNTDPLLLPLANNGGPTLTMALKVGSPALNAADPTMSPSTDQRGFARPSGIGYDIGAYEGAGSPTVQIFRENSLTNLVRSVGEIGCSYRLEQTASFQGWTSIATNNIPVNGFIEFRVPVNPSSRFFRIVAE